MTLETYSDLPILSPLNQAWVKVGAQLFGRDVRYSLLHIRGAEAEMVLQQTSMKIGDVVSMDDDGMLARLRRDEFILFTIHGHADLSRVEAQVGERRVTVTDITHGRCVLIFHGPEAIRVLHKVCALDFSAVFSNWHAAQTSLAKVRTLIIGSNEPPDPAYWLVVDRSLAQYVWDVIADAMQEFAN